MGMAPKKINFGRTTIARAKAAVKRNRAAKRKKPAHNQKDNPKQVELEPKLNALMDTLNSQIRWLRRTTQGPDERTQSNHRRPGQSPRTV
jgi:hypothetical protein